MNAPAWISLGVTIVVGGIFFLLTLETHLLVHQQTPISSYTRRLVTRWPGPAIGAGGVIVFAVGLLFAHFFWDAPLG